MKISIISDGYLSAFKQYLYSSWINRDFDIEFVCFVSQEPSAFNKIVDRKVLIKRLDLSSKSVGWRYILNDSDFTASDYCFLFLHHLVPEELYSMVPTINFHPSCLPKFKGLDGLKNAREAKHLGFSSHFVDSNIDGGKLIYQVQIMPFPRFDRKDGFFSASSMLCAATIGKTIQLLGNNITRANYEPVKEQYSTVDEFLNSAFG